MKKLVISLSVVSVISLGLLFVSSFYYNNKKEDNLKLQQDIVELREENTNQVNNNQTKELESKNLKETNKEQLLELEQWKQIKEKLELAL